jgi:transcriptional regulator with XRE-family HTH domain
MSYAMILLRHWRERRGYSVRALAKRAGVGYVSIVRIEMGRMSPTVAMLEKLAKALGIGVRDFFPVERVKRQITRVRRNHGEVR